MKILLILTAVLISPILANADNTGGRGGDGGPGSWGILRVGDGGSGGNGGPGKTQDKNNSSSKQNKIEVEGAKIKKYILNI